MCSNKNYYRPGFEENRIWVNIGTNCESPFTESETVFPPSGAKAKILPGDTFESVRQLATIPHKIVLLGRMQNGRARGESRLTRIYTFFF